MPEKAKIIIKKNGNIIVDGLTDEQICKICKRLGNNVNCPKEKSNGRVTCWRLAPCG